MDECKPLLGAHPAPDTAVNPVATDTVLAAWSTESQGLTLVFFSAKCKRFPCDRGCI